MSILGLVIPACMNSTNLFLSSELTSPLINPAIESHFSWSLGYGNGWSYKASIPRLPSLYQPSTPVGSLRTQTSTIPSEGYPERLNRSSSIAASVLPQGKASQRLHIRQELELVDPVNPGHPDLVLPTEAHVAGTRQKDSDQKAREFAIDQSIHAVSPARPFRFRTHRADEDTRSASHLARPSRLWNPTNFTPRLPPAVYTQPAHPRRRRRPSSPPPPAISVVHPVLDATSILDDQVATGASSYPLLTLPEQRQSRHLTPTRSSFQIEGQLSGSNRISIPSAVRQSYDLKRATSENATGKSLRRRDRSVTRKARAPAQSSNQVESELDEGKGKGKAVMSSNNAGTETGFSNDLERGPGAHGHQSNRSNLSLPGGIGSAISSSDSSMVGDPDQPGLGDEWGPQHPCFPHLNPYVPINSAEYQTTRIIRVRRDWLIAGDLAPTFSNIYPEILDVAGVSETEFRRIIEYINTTLISIFSPYNWRNIVDGVLGVLSGWVWEDIGLTNVKTKLNAVEAWIEKWNAEMEKTVGSEEGFTPPKIISLRRTGYMTLDFQIPDPEYFRANSEPGSRSGPPGAEPRTEPMASSAL
ncbi:Golgin subfamily A member 7/ERF4 family-domain-containing protein [Xylariaceae sp. FL0594]|nr:Golgin subfamily A member 7/ERF4 family-domain-containing protein [Xylariaceae sp. FL0594]